MTDLSTERNIRLHLPDVAVTRVSAKVLRGRPVPPAPIRELQRAAVKAGALDWRRRWLEPLCRVRERAGLPGGPPRFLVRIDEFPDASAFDRPERAGLEPARRFHAVMQAAGVPHLMAVVPQLTHAALDPAAEGGRALDQAEIEHLHQMASDGVVFAQHGTTHRTRHRSPRRRSELCGLAPEQTAELLDRGRATLSAWGIEPRVFVAPFNRFDARQWSVLSERYDLVCGGPESIRLLGWHGGPLWRGDAVYLPCYPPLYGRAGDMVEAVTELIEQAPGTWIPLVLHLAWEADEDFVGLRRLAERIAPYSVNWDAFLADLDRSRVRR